ncbi:hypothetical protein RRG08_055536 [Elysia crispata]|uniref:Uncharacterized protein n=1 Tax=Elysia crispata TaxID=231223 RepID=A0AAE1AD31_9GAST|nr:hypothetical protein RRG08_055536 [Elysia crispata]
MVLKSDRAPPHKGPQLSKTVRWIESSVVKVGQNRPSSHSREAKPKVKCYRIGCSGVATIKTRTAQDASLVTRWVHRGQVLTPELKPTEITGSAWRRQTRTAKIITATTKPALQSCRLILFVRKTRKSRRDKKQVLNQAWGNYDKLTYELTET